MIAKNVDVADNDHMKRLICIFAALLTLFALPASSDYTYSGMQFGYGYSYYGEQSHHAVSLGFSAGYTDISESSDFGIGAGTRVNMLIESGNSTPLSITTLIGPELVFPFTSAVSLRLLAGPSFNMMDTGDGKTSVFSIAPAADLSFEFTIPDFDLFTLSIGTSVYGQIGVGHPMGGITVTPYASMLLRFGSSSRSDSLIIY